MSHTPPDPLLAERVTTRLKELWSLRYSELEVAVLERFLRAVLIELAPYFDVAYTYPVWQNCYLLVLEKALLKRLSQELRLSHFFAKKESCHDQQYEAMIQFKIEQARAQVLAISMYDFRLTTEKGEKIHIDTLRPLFQEEGKVKHKQGMLKIGDLFALQPELFFGFTL